MYQLTSSAQEYILYPINMKLSQWNNLQWHQKSSYYRPHSERMGKVLFSQVSLFSGARGLLTFQLRGNTYLPANEGYLPSSQWGAPTIQLTRGEDTYPDRGYLPWVGIPWPGQVPPAQGRYPPARVGIPPARVGTPIPEPG